MAKAHIGLSFPFFDSISGEIIRVAFNQRAENVAGETELAYNHRSLCFEKL